MNTFQRVRKCMLGAVALGALMGPILVPLAPATAADPIQFQPGLIISDEIFFNSSLMSEQQVQSFLEFRVPNCQAGQGQPGCLRDYRSSSQPFLAGASCGLYQGGTNELASRIIFNIATACNINPQVLLVLLEKEQSLVSSTNPSESRYRIATGYGCPDTAPCDTQYYGFANQVFRAARQLQRYGDVSAGFNFYAGRNNTIQWHPNASCGSSSVYIENRATAALYNYTPYRPNQGALSNLYGSGDACSSYGNRNFWRIFTDWFGSPIISPATSSFVKAVYPDVLGRPASDAERLNWSKAIMSGMPRSQVAGAFVNSDEFRLLKIDFAYRDVLGREPEAGGRLSWLNGMKQGTLSPDDAYRSFLQSDEYFNLTGGNIQSFVTAVYAKIIKRPAVASEVDYWTGIANAQGRSSAVNSIWFSVETSRTRVTDMYSAYLGRVPDYPGLIQWGDLALFYGDSWVRSAILGSDEYLGRARILFP